MLCYDNIRNNIEVNDLIDIIAYRDDSIPHIFQIYFKIFRGNFFN